MEETEKYLGWCNRITWLVALWLDNERSDYEYWKTAACEAWGEAPQTPAMLRWGFSREQAAAYLLAEQMRVEISEAEEVPVTGMLADLLGDAFAQVAWVEIAEHYLQDVGEDSDPPENGEPIAAIAPLARKQGGL
jgi:hypothetical protein